MIKDSDILENPVVRKAIVTLQNGDARSWLSLFVKNAILYDHGNEMTAGGFIEKSIGREYFTSIDKTEDGGFSVFGSFHTDQWGDFKARFSFQLDEKGKINRLDVSQAAY